MTAEAVAFARAHFSLSIPGSDGVARRAHLEAAAKGGSPAAQAELDAADAATPGPGKYLWDWFLELSAGRGSSGFGPSPLAWSEVEAWCRLTGRRPANWEVMAIRAIDAAYMEARSDVDRQRAKQRPGAA